MSLVLTLGLLELRDHFIHLGFLIKQNIIHLFVLSMSHVRLVYCIIVCHFLSLHYLLFIIYILFFINCTQGNVGIGSQSPVTVLYQSNLLTKASTQYNVHTNRAFT